MGLMTYTQMIGFIDNNKRISLVSYKNQPRIDIREFYHDFTGQSKPSQKGVSLSIDSFLKLNTFLSIIDSSQLNDFQLNDFQLNDFLLLDHNKRVSLVSFKNKLRIDIREFYIDSNGLSKPTKKGVSISFDYFDNLKNSSSLIFSQLPKTS
jgi:hypothetical protein